MDYKNGTKPSHKESQIERGTCPNCGCDFKFLGKETDDEIRPMTPLEHQWMDFKKILSELVVFQEDYEEQTKDKCPGNQYYSDKLMVIVDRAKKAISESELPSVNFRDGRPYNYCPTCGREEPPDETDEEISLRMWEEYERYILDCQGEGLKPATFPDWLKERVE